MFDGASMLFDETGRLVARAQQFDEDLLVVDLDVRPAFRRRLLDPRGRSRGRCAARGRGQRGAPRRAPRGAARSRRCCRRCARSTRRSCSAPATTCARTASPTCSSGSPVASTRRSSPRSRPTRSGPSTSSACSCRRATRARAASPTPSALAANLGIRTLTVPIEAAHAAFLDLLAEPFEGTEPGLAGENLQARIRGTILMSADQQARRARAHRGQQERDGHRLRHALRRHDRRLRGHQGRPEDARVRARRATATSGRCAR